LLLRRRTPPPTLWRPILSPIPFQPSRFVDPLALPRSRLVVVIDDAATGDGGSGRVDLDDKGTYDGHNWNVLQERWDDLRAQLHGDAVPARLRVSEDAEGRTILDEIEAARPNFSPRKK
jgi:hypothetical protein